MADHRGALGRRGISGAHCCCDLWWSHSELLGGYMDSGQRGTQVALDVVGECLHRGDVENAAALSLRWSGVCGDPVDRPQKRRKGLAGTGGGVNEGVMSLRDCAPAVDLGPRRLRKGGFEPSPRGFRESIQRHRKQRTRPR